MRNYYLLLISIIFICGVFLASFGVFRHISTSAIFISVIILFTFLCLSVKKDLLFITLLVIMLFLLGAVSYNVFNRIDKDNIKNYAYHSLAKVLVIGKVASDIEESQGGKKKIFTLEANSIKLQDSWKRASGLALVNVYGKQALPFRYGDIILTEALLRRPYSYGKQSKFDYKEYLANKRIYSLLNVRKGFFLKKIGEDKRFLTRIIGVIYFIRTSIETHIRKFLDPPYSSMLTAIILGKRRGIPSGLRDLFAKTGTLHILAISGLHVGIIYFVLRIILKVFNIPKNTSVVISILFLIFYAILAGARASILRSAAMFSILGFGELFRRKISTLNLVGLSCFIILMINPNQVFDIGFTLSYTAVLSIVIISPIIYRLFLVDKMPAGPLIFWQKVKHYFLRAISVSLAAWLGLLPLIAYYFGLVTPIVIVANLVVIPLLVAVMGSAILFVSFGFLSGLLATIFAQAVWFFLFILIKSVRLLKDVPLGYFETPSPPAYSVILYYIILGIIIKYSKKNIAKNQLFYF